MQATGFDSDSVVGTLEAVSRLQALRVEAEAGLFELAAVFADQGCRPRRPGPPAPDPAPPDPTPTIPAAAPAATRPGAGFAALRARSVDVPLDLDPPDPGPDAGPASEADEPEESDVSPAEPDPMARMDGFARRVGFTPTRLPAWLTARPPALETGVPAFSFDWAGLLPPLTLYLHLTDEDLTRDLRGRDAGGVVRWEGRGR